MDEAYFENELNKQSAMLLSLRADCLANQALIEAIAKTIRVDGVDGLTFFQWHAKNRIAQLERLLILLEDSNPALAAALQHHVDQARKDFQS